MSDFTGDFWSVYVAGITLVGIVACLLLLWITSRKKVEATADNTTGHVWDEDLTEMNNPMPRWWMWLFVATIVFAFLYLAAYPGLGTYQGQLGWSSRDEYRSEVDKATRDLAPLYAQF
ncbi:MAG: cbb3-type cytochrome c oxidase N-terminal domain-containing protein, partial [Ramlibacter sp.]